MKKQKKKKMIMKKKKTKKIKMVKKIIPTIVKISNQEKPRWNNEIPDGSLSLLRKWRGSRNYME